MREKCLSKAERLVDKIVDRTYDHSDFQGREELRERLKKKSTGELEEIWEHGENA